jgi:UDP-arabinose 4-epimerase
MTETILVTGGAGFVGSHLCKRLARAGYRPVVYDNLSNGHADFVRWGPLVTGDIIDCNHLIATLRAHDIKTVFHCAALIDVRQSVIDPAACYQVNAHGMTHLLAAMQETGASRLIFSSTCAVYGVPKQKLIAEDHPRLPVNPYGRSKLAAEHQIEDAVTAGWLQAIILRYFNAAGADPDGELGESHQPETHAIPLAILAALGQRSGFDLFGDDYQTPDGTAIRDYIHVNDLASAHLAALDYLNHGGISTAINLGTGRGHSVADIIKAVERRAGNRLNIHPQPRRPGDVALLVADATRAHDLLSWQAALSDLDQLIDHAWQWFATGKGISR